MDESKEEGYVIVESHWEGDGWEEIFTGNVSLRVRKSLNIQS